MSDRDDTESASFETLLRPHMDGLFRLAFRLAGSRPEAEDLFQDVLTRMYARLDELAALEQPAPWLRRVLYNHFIDNRRRYARQRLLIVEEHRLPGAGIEALPGMASGRPEEEAARQDDIGRLERALAALSDDYREAVLLHDVEGYRIAEIAAMTGAPDGTIKARLHRARARLRALLDDPATFSAT
jgi:RNA polymerase sigma factor (sigma-70 family)